MGVFPSASLASPPRHARRVRPSTRCLPTSSTQHDPRAHPRAPVPHHPSMKRWYGSRRIRPAVRPTSPRCQTFVQHPPALAAHAHPSSPERALEGWVRPRSGVLVKAPCTIRSAKNGIARRTECLPPVRRRHDASRHAVPPPTRALLRSTLTEGQTPLFAHLPPPP